VAVLKLNEFQKFIKNFFFKIASSLITTIVSILLISHFSEVLLVEGFGKFNFLMTYSSYFALFVSLGMDIAALRLIALNRENLKEIFGALIPLKIILSIFVFVIMNLPVFFVEKMSGYGLLILVFSTAVLASPFSVQPVFEAVKRIEFPASINIIIQVINYIAARILVKKPDDIIYAAVLVAVVAFVTVIIHNIVFLRFFGRLKFVFKRDLCIELITSGLVIGFIQITATMIHYFDVFMLGFMKNDYSVGQYSASYRAMFLIVSLSGIIHNLMSPILFETFQKSKELYKNYFETYMKFMIFAGCGITVIFFVLAEDYLGIFFNLENYSESILCFRILIIALFFFTINGPLHIGMLSARHEKALLGIIVMQLIFNVTGNWLLIPEYGIYGSAVSTVVTEAVGFPVYIVFFRKILKINIKENFIIAVIAVVPVGLFLHYSSVFFIARAVVGVCIFVILIVVLRGYTFEEINKIKSALLSFEKK